MFTDPWQAGVSIETSRDAVMAETVQEHCVLADPGFRAHGQPVFRRAADGVPAMVVAFGEREAVVPLGPLQRQLGIDDASPDGRMLRLIAEALDFVPELRLGDRLPSEVLTGEASWSPAPHHRARAAAVLRGRLLAAVALHGAAAVQAADTLVLPLAHEIAYIEALRETLLLRTEAMARAVRALGHGWNGHANGHATLAQVARLAEAAASDLAARFAAVDAVTADIRAALRDLAGRRAAIRAHRDGLVRTARAFAPVLDAWDTAPTRIDDSVWPLLARTWRLLAARCMAVQEWERAGVKRPRDTAPHP
jgi:hypothetical protein